MCCFVLTNGDLTSLPICIWSLPVCSQVAQHLVATYGGKAFDVAKMAQVTGQRWPIVGKRLVSEFPYIEGEVKWVSLAVRLVS